MVWVWEVGSCISIQVSTEARGWLLELELVIV